MQNWKQFFFCKKIVIHLSNQCKEIESHWMKIFSLKFLLSIFFRLSFMQIFLFYLTFMQNFGSVCVQIIFFLRTNAILELAQRLNKLDFWSKVKSDSPLYFVSTFLAYANKTIKLSNKDKTGIDSSTQVLSLSFQENSKFCKIADIEN